jgi:hypothetical protein
MNNSGKGKYINDDVPPREFLKDYVLEVPYEMANLLIDEGAETILLIFPVNDKRCGWSMTYKNALKLPDGFSIPDIDNRLCLFRNKRFYSLGVSSKSFLNRFVNLISSKKDNYNDTNSLTVTANNISEQNSSSNKNRNVPIVIDRELLRLAGELIVTYQHASATLLQAKFKFGFDDTCRLLEKLEEIGIIGPLEGSKPRELKVVNSFALEAFLKEIKGSFLLELNKGQQRNNTTKEISNLFGLEFQIFDVEQTQLTNGEDAYIFYFQVVNTTSKSRKIKLQEATYITGSNEQIDQDIWLRGYLIGESTLKPNAKKSAGFVFYENKLPYIVDKDSLHITIELLQDGFLLSLIFVRESSSWLLTEYEKTDIEIKLSPKQLEKNLLRRVQRLDAFEERFNIRFEKLSIRVENSSYNSFKLLGELHSTIGTELKSSLRIVCVLYDNSGGIIQQSEKSIYKGEFFAFEVFEFYFYGDSFINDIASIRIYPKN